MAGQRRELDQELDFLRTRNQAALDAMEAIAAELRQLTGNQSITCTVPLELRLMIMLELLANKMFPPGSVYRLGLDIAYEQRLWDDHLSKGPAQARDELNQFKLAQGGVVVP